MKVYYKFILGMIGLCLWPCSVQASPSITIDDVSLIYEIGQPPSSSSFDEEYKQYPLPEGVIIKVWGNCRGVTLGYIGECETDSNGKINTVMALPSTFADTPDEIWFEIVMQTDYAIVIPGQPDTIPFPSPVEASVLTHKTPTIGPVPSDSSVFHASVLVGYESTQMISGALHILTWIGEANRWICEKNPSFIMPKITVSQDIKALTGVVSEYSPAHEGLFIVGKYCYQRESIVHEYGHAIEDELFPIFVADYIDTHNYFTMTNREEALSEGWAEFLSIAVTDNLGYFYRDVESDLPWQGRPNASMPRIGQMVEGAVVNSLWDLYDEDNEDERYSIISPGVAQQNFYDNIWKPLDDVWVFHPQNIAEFYIELQKLKTAANPADIGTRTKVRGIFEHNGIVFSRAGMDPLPPATNPDTAWDGIFYQYQLIGSHDLTDTPVSAAPIPSIEHRLQFCLDTMPYGATREEEWRRVSLNIHTETKWMPNDATTGFGTTSSGVSNLILFMENGFGISSSMSDLLKLEGEVLAARVQNKDEYYARDSFYPEFNSATDSPHNTAQWLNDPAFSMNTLRFGLVDRYRPFLVKAMVRNISETGYIGQWICSANLDFVADAGAVGGGIQILQLTFSEPVDTPSTIIYGYDTAGTVKALATDDPRVWLRNLSFPIDPSAMAGQKRLWVSTRDRNYNHLTPFSIDDPITLDPALEDIDGSDLMRHVGVIAGPGGPDELHRFRVAFLRLDGVDSGASGVANCPAVGHDAIRVNTHGLDTDCKQVAFAVNGDTVIDSAFPFETEWYSNHRVGGGVSPLNELATFKDGETYVIGAELTDDLNHKGRLPVYARIYGVGDTVPFMQSGGGRISKEIMLDNFRPFVSWVTVTDTTDTVYDAGWSWNGSGLQFVANARRVYGDGPLTITTRFSEPVVNPTLWAHGLDAAATAMSAADTRGMLWTRTISVPTADMLGIKQLEFAATDRTGNKLVPLKEATSAPIDPVTFTTLDGTSFKRVGGLHLGNGGTDEVHWLARADLKIDDVDSVPTAAHERVRGKVLLWMPGFTATGCTVVFSVSNNGQSRTSVDAAAPFQWDWNTQESLAGASVASVPIEALWPDGVPCTMSATLQYKGAELKVRAFAHINGVGDTQVFMNSSWVVPSVVPDNFRPFADRVAIGASVSGAATYYDGLWKYDGANLRFDTTANVELGMGSYGVVISFSEPVKGATLTIDGIGAVSLAPLYGDTIWRGYFTLSPAMSALNGVHTLTIEACDLMGNKLLPFSKPANSPFNPLSGSLANCRLTRDAAGSLVVVPGGLDGNPDMLHKFRILITAQWLKIDSVQPKDAISNVVRFGVGGLKGGHVVTIDGLPGSMGDSLPFPYTDSWNTRVDNYGGLAWLNQLARYPDGGTYQFSASSTPLPLVTPPDTPIFRVYANINGVADTVLYESALGISRPVVIDNFRPYVREVTVGNSAYHAEWQYHDPELMLNVDTTPMNIGKYDVSIVFSEPVSAASLFVGGGIGDIPLTSTGDNVTWKGQITIGFTTPNGEKIMRIDATDLVGNTLIPFISQSLVDPSDYASGFYRGAADAYAGVGGADKRHRLTVEKKPTNEFVLIDSTRKAASGPNHVVFGDVNLTAFLYNNDTRNVLFHAAGSPTFNEHDFKYEYADTWLVGRRSGDSVARWNNEAIYHEGRQYAVTAEADSSAATWYPLEVHANIDGVADNSLFQSSPNVSRTVIVDNFRPWVTEVTASKGYADGDWRISAETDSELTFALEPWSERASWINGKYAGPLVVTVRFSEPMDTKTISVGLCGYMMPSISCDNYPTHCVWKGQLLSSQLESSYSQDNGQPIIISGRDLAGNEVAGVSVVGNYDTNYMSSPDFSRHAVSGEFAGDTGVDVVHQLAIDVDSPAIIIVSHIPAKWPTKVPTMPDSASVSFYFSDFLSDTLTGSIGVRSQKTGYIWWLNPHPDTYVEGKIPDLTISARQPLFTIDFVIGTIADTYEFVGTIFDEHGNEATYQEICTTGGAKIMSTDPTFIVGDERVELPDTAALYQQYLSAGYPELSRQAVQITGAPRYSPYTALPAAAAAQLAIPSQALSDATPVSVNGTNDWRPSLVLPGAVVRESDYRALISAALGAPGIATNAYDSGWQAVSALASSFNANQQQRLYDVVVSTLGIENGYTASLAGESERIAGEYGRADELAQLIANGASATDIAELQASAAAAVAEQTSRARAELRAAALAKATLLHESVNCAGQTAAQAFYRELQSAVATAKANIRAELGQAAVPEESAVLSPTAPTLDLTATAAQQGMVVDIKGKLTAAQLANYTVRYGAGANPTAWQAIGATHTMATGTEAEVLARWFTGELPHGVYTVSVIASDENGENAEARATITTGGVFDDAASTVDGGIVSLDGLGNAQQKYAYEYIIAPQQQTLASPATLIISYPAGLESSDNLQIVRYEETSNSWLPLETATDTATHTASAMTSVFGRFALPAGGTVAPAVSVSEQDRIQRLWASRSWIAPEVEGPRIPHDVMFYHQASNEMSEASVILAGQAGTARNLQTGVPVGMNETYWDGSGSNGAPMAVGSYVCQIAPGAGSEFTLIREYPATSAQAAGLLKAAGADGSYALRDGRVARLNQDGTVAEYLTETGRYGDAADLAVDESGSIWVLDRARWQIEKLATDGTSQGMFGGFGTELGQFSDPTMLASVDGWLAVWDAGRQRLTCLDRTGDALFATGTGKPASRIGSADISGIVRLYDDATDIMAEYALAGTPITVKDLLAEIELPYDNSLVRANVPVTGFACGRNFLDYRVEYGQGWQPDSWVTIEWSNVAQNDPIDPSNIISNDRTIEGNLATWATGLTEYDYSMHDPRCVDQGIDGPYTVKLTTRNASGRTEQDEVRVTVGRVMSNTYEGTVISPDGMVVLIVPEQALATDLMVMSIDAADVAPSAPAGMAQLGRMYEVRPAGTEFTRPCLFEWTVTEAMLDQNGDGSEDYDTAAIQLYHYDPVVRQWEHCGGMWDAGTPLIRLEIDEIAASRGYYALLADYTTPAAPVLDAPRAAQTEQATAIVTGQAEALTRIALRINGEPAATATPAANGSFWSAVSLSQGENVIDAMAIDGAGHASTWSNAITITRSRVEPESVSGLIVGNSDFTALASSEVTAGQVLGIELTGTDADMSALNRAGVNIVYGAHEETAELLETGLNTGVYRLQWTVPCPAEGALPNGSAVRFTSAADASRTVTLTYSDITAPRIAGLQVGDEPMVQQRFEEATAATGWTTGADVTQAIVATDEAASAHALRFTNAISGGGFRFDYAGEPYNVDQHQLLSFDYRMTTGTKLDLLAKVGGKWYVLGLTGGYTGSCFDVNIERLADLGGVADGSWRRATIDLAKALEPVTRARTVEALCFADWSVTGFMRLIPGGRNAQGSWLELDNFVISGATRTPATISASATDESGLERLGWQMTAPDGVSSETSWMSPSDGTDEYGLPAQAGIYRLQMTVEDAAGNTAQAEMPVLLDNEPPVLRESYEYQASPSMPFSMKLIDNGSGIDLGSIVLEVNGATYTAADTHVMYRSDNATLYFDGTGLGLPHDNVVTLVVTSVRDRAGNAPANLPWSTFARWNEEKVVISEVCPAGDEFGNDFGSWVELHCVSGPVDIAASAFYDKESRTREDVRLSQAPVTLQTGDYAVVHWGSGLDEADNGSGWEDYNGNGIRDLYYDNDSVLNADEDQLEYRGQFGPSRWDGTKYVFDAVAWKRNPLTAMNRYEYADVQHLSEEGEWVIPNNSVVNSLVVLGDNTSIARRNPLVDTNRAADWVAVHSATPGVANDGSIDNTPPATPAGLTVTGGDRNITLQWEQVADADVTGYRVYRSDVAGPLCTVANTGSHVDAGVTPGVTYWYSVSAIDGSGNEGRRSGSVSGEAQRTVPAPLLFAPDPARVTGSRVRLEGVTFTDRPTVVTVTGDTGTEYGYQIVAPMAEQILPANSLQNVFGCALASVEYQDGTTTRTDEYYTLQTPPDRWIVCPFTNRLYGWEPLSDESDWKADGILHNGAGQQMVFRNVGLDEYTVRLNARGVGGNTAFWLAATNDNGYRLRFDMDNSTVRFEKVVAGAVTEFGQWENDRLTEWNEYALVLAGDQVLVTENGEVRVLANDADGVPAWCKGMSIDNRGGDMQYNNVDVYHGDLIGVLSTGPISRGAMGALYGARLDGYAPAGSVTCEIGNRIGNLQGFGAGSVVPVSGDTFNVFFTLLRQGDESPAPLVRAVHLDAGTGFRQQVMLHEGENSFAVSEGEGESARTGNIVTVTRVVAPALSISEISGEEMGFNGDGYMEIVNNGTEPVALARMSAGWDWQDNVFALDGDPGTLAPGARALLRAGWSSESTENDATGDLNNNGVRDISLHTDGIDLTSTGMVTLLWDGAALDAVPFTYDSLEATTAQAQLKNMGMWIGEACEFGPQQAGRLTLSRREDRIGDMASDWLFTRPTPGAVNSPYPVPYAGQVVINEVQLGDSGWVELLVTSGSCDAGAVLLEGMNVASPQPVTAQAGLWQAGDRLMTALTVPTNSDADQLQLSTGLASIDAVSWQMAGTVASDAEKNEHALLLSYGGRWAGAPAVIQTTNRPFGRIPDGIDGNTASDWRTVLSTPMTYNRYDSEVPVVALAVADNAMVRGTIAIVGTVSDIDLANYTLTCDTSAGSRVLASGTDCIVDGTIASLNTKTLADGAATIRLTAIDGSTQQAALSRNIVVDNTAPGVSVVQPPTSFVMRDNLPIEMTMTDSSSLTWRVWVTNAAGQTLWSEDGSGEPTVDFATTAEFSGSNGKITLRWSVTDAAGNTKTGSRAGTLMSNDPGAAAVLITELDMTPDEGPRWTELTAVRGPVNIAGWKLSDLDGTDVPLASSAVTLQAGDVVAVYWGDGDDETDAPGGWVDLNGNGVRDLYLGDPAPATTDDQIALLNGDVVVDAVAISDYDGSLPADEATDMGWLYDHWGWNEDGRVGGQQVAAQLNLPGWGSIGRIPGAPDTGRKADWVGMRPSPGIANKYVAPAAAGSVLINEVKIDDFFETEKDWVELYCVSGPVDVGSLILGDLDTIEEERLLTPEAPFTMNTGEYCVIHLSPVIGDNETDNASSGNWTDLNGNGIRDIYASMPQLPATDEQLALYALDGSIVDAVCWSNRDGSIEDDEAYDNSVLANVGAWIGDGSQADAAHLQSHIYTLGRIPNAIDSNRASEWQPCVLTPGAANVAVGDDHVPPQTWLESWGPMSGDGTDTCIAPWSQFYMRSFDDLSGVAEKHVQIDNGADRIYGDPIVLADEGWHTITYWGVDNAGNVEPAHTLRVYTDATAPQVNLSLDAQNRLVIAATDDVAGVGDIRFSHVGQSMEEYSGPAAFYGPGEYKVRYEVRDRVSNATIAEQVMVVPENLPAPSLNQVPELTNIANLNISGEAVSGARIEIERNGNVAAAVEAARHEVTIPITAFTERSAGVVEDGNFLTLQPYHELWADDFEDGSISDWTQSSGNWQAENGVLVGRSLAWARIDYARQTNEPSYSITGRYRNVTDHAQTMVGFNVDSQFNMYRLLTFGWGGMVLNKHVAVGNQWPHLSPVVGIADYRSGEWQTFRIDRRVDGGMRVRVGSTTVEGADSDYSGGFFVLAAWDPNANKAIEVNFDDVRVFTGAPAQGIAAAGTADISGLGTVAQILVSTPAGSGTVDLYSGADAASRVQLYRLVGQDVTGISPYLVLGNDNPAGIQPRCGGITFVGMADYSATIPLSEGENRLVACAAGEEGTRSAGSEERVVILDTQKPVIAGVSVTPASFSPEHESAVLGFTLADNLASRLGSLRVTVTDEAGTLVRELLNATPAAYGARSVAWNGLNAAGNEVAAGGYLFRIEAADAAGNQATASATMRVQSDVTPPQISISSPVNGAQLSYAQNLTLQWTVSDTESGVAGSSATLDGQAVTAGQSVNLLTLGVGSHTLAITASDNAGNSASASAVFSVIDDVPPSITLQQPATPTNQDVTLNYSATDVITPANQLVITGDNSPYTAEGSYSVALTATDAAGNSASSNTVTFVIDKTAPECGMSLDLTDASGAVAVPETLITLTVIDAGCGVASIEYAINGGSWIIYSAPFELKQAGITSGVVTIAFRATDIAGNVSGIVSRTVTVKPALELSAGLLNAPRVLAWWNEPADGQHPSKDASLAALQAVLDSVALNYRIVENAADFKAALADYNTYLILGDQVTLDDAGDLLVAAQVALGKSLISLGYEDIATPESTDRGWQNIFGIKVAGVLNGTSELTVSQGDLVADTLNLVIEGQTERITEVMSGDVLGTVTLTESGERNGNGGNGNGNGGNGNGNGGNRQTTYSAIVANGWGLGKVLYAVPEYSRNLSGLADVLRNAVVWGAPAQEIVTPGGSVALRIAVKNAVLPVTLTVNVEALVPTGGDVVAVYDDGEDRGSYVTWFDDLVATATGEYRCVLRLPSELTGCVVRVDAAYLKGGSYRNAGSVEMLVQ